MVILIVILVTKSTPIVTPKDNKPQIPDFINSPETCILPTKLGLYGKVKLIEDCETLERFEKHPVPLDNFDPRSFGVHPVVCCPRQIHDHIILFKTDPEHPNYVDQYTEQYEDEYYSEGTDSDIFLQSTVSEILNYESKLQFINRLLMISVPQ